MGPTSEPLLWRWTDLGSAFLRGARSSTIHPRMDTMSMDFEVPPSVLRLIKHILQKCGDPRFWLQQWQYQRGLRDNDRTFHDMKKITDGDGGSLALRCTSEFRGGGKAGAGK